MSEWDFFTSRKGLIEKEGRVYFDFKDMAPSKNLTYEKLSSANSYLIHSLFAKDTNPYINPDFKVKEKAEQYTDYVIKSAFSFKRAGCDFFFKVGENYAGVLHLYDMSLETIDGKHNTSCCIGYTTVAKFREQGLTTEAVRHLLNYVYSSFEIDTIYAYTGQENLASNLLLCRQSFILYESSYSNFFKRIENYYYLPKAHFYSPEKRYLKITDYVDIPASKHLQFLALNISVANDLVQLYNLATLSGTFESNESIWYEEKEKSIKQESDKLYWQRANGIAAWWVICEEGKAVGVCRLKDVGKLIKGLDKSVLDGAWFHYKFFMPIPVSILSEFLEHIYSYVISEYGVENLIIENSRTDLG